MTVLVWEESDWNYAHAEVDQETILSVGRRLPMDDASRSLASEFLAGVPIFRDMPPKLREQTAKHLWRMKVADGSILVSDREQDSSLFIIESGSVATYHDQENDEDCLTSNLTGSDLMLHSHFGQKQILHHPRDTFSQVEFATEAKSGFTAVCRGATVVVVMDREHLPAEIESMVKLMLQRYQRKRFDINGEQVFPHTKELFQSQDIQGPDAAAARSVPLNSHGGSEAAWAEVDRLTAFHDIAPLKMCQELSTRSIVYMSSHITPTLVKKGQDLVIRENQVNQIVAVIEGALHVFQLAKGVANAQPQLVESIRAGETFEPQHAKDEYGHELVLWVTAKEDTECCVLDLGYYRVSLRKTITDNATAARYALMHHTLFTSLPYYTFERLSRLAKWARFDKNERIFTTEDEQDESIKILVSGEFKVTRKLPHQKALAMLGPGHCFGFLDPEDIGRTQPFAVFAFSEVKVIEISAKELQVLLPEDVLAKLDEQLEASSSVAEKTQNEVTLLGKPAGSKKSLLAQAVVPGGVVPGDDVLEEGIVPPLQHLEEDDAAYQTTYGSGTMTTFFESVKKGKVIPTTDGESTKRVGRKPEEVLPSLRPQYIAQRLAELNATSSLEFLKPKEADAVLSADALKLRNARKAGIKILPIFQDRVDKLRQDTKLRQRLKTVVKEHRKEYMEKRALEANILQRNIDITSDKVMADQMRVEKANRDEVLEEKMGIQRNINEQVLEDKAERALAAISRKERNDQRNLERLDEIRREAARVKLKAVWLMVTALASRAAAWEKVFATVKRTREDFALWVAAAISIQRRFRKFVSGVVRRRKELAANLLAKNFRVHLVGLRIQRKQKSAPIILTFLREAIKQMRDIRFHFQRYRQNVVKVQTFYRNIAVGLRTMDAQILRFWDAAELQFRKSEGDRVAMPTKGAARKPKTKSQVAIPPFPQELRTKYVRKLSVVQRKAHGNRKSVWRGHFKEWISREEYRVLVFKQKSSLAGDDMAKDIKRDKLLMTWLDPNDPPPRCPLFDPCPNDAVLATHVRSCYEETMALFKAQRGVATKKDQTKGTTKKKK